MKKYLSQNISLEINLEKCIGCALCQVVCPHQLFKIENRKAIIIDKSYCIECGACMSNCPRAAITVNAGTGCAIAVLNTKK